MVKIQELTEFIKNSGITITALSKKSGIDRATLYNRFKSVGEFTASEIVSLSLALKLTRDERDYYFLS